jgi:hypothetical protein
MEVTLIKRSIHISMKETAHCTCLNIPHHVHFGSMVHPDSHTVPD